MLIIEIQSLIWVSIGRIFQQLRNKELLCAIEHERGYIGREISKSEQSSPLLMKKLKEQ